MRWGDGGGTVAPPAGCVAAKPRPQHQVSPQREKGERIGFIGIILQVRERSPSSRKAICRARRGRTSSGGEEATADGPLGGPEIEGKKKLRQGREERREEGGREEEPAGAKNCEQSGLLVGQWCSRLLVFVRMFLPVCWLTLVTIPRVRRRAMDSGGGSTRFLPWPAPHSRSRRASTPPVWPVGQWSGECGSATYCTFG